MRIVNGILFGILFVLLLTGMLVEKGRWKNSRGMMYLKNHTYLIICLLAVNSISFGLGFRQENREIYVEKEEYGGQEQQIEILLEKEDAAKKVTLNVRPRILTDKDCRRRMEEAFSYLDRHLKGENTSLSKLTENLELSMDYEKYPFDIELCPEDYILMDENGILKNTREELLAAGYQEENLVSGIETHMTVVLWYDETSREKTYTGIIYPKEKNGTEQLFEKAKEKLAQWEEEALYQEGFAVPDSWEGIKLTRLGENRVTPFGVLLFGFVFTALLLVREEETKKRKTADRRDRLLRCYPWFVNELVLLLRAGIQVKNIFEILLNEYEEETKQKCSGRAGKQSKRKNREKRLRKEQADDRVPLMEELNAAKRSMELGMPEEQVYYKLGRHLKLPCYLKLMTLLEQNVKRGTKGLTAIFEQEELAALEERKNLAKRFGEEAGTKLLGPMILLLFVIMLMIMIPSFMSFL